MGDFTGFSFGNWHSSDPETGLVTVLRVSGGDRYEEELHPEIKDRTAEVPGINGEYYFGSDYGTRTFNIEIAYDSLTEGQFRELRKVFGTREIKELIFDERPYKKYMAKIESPMELSYVCFDEYIKTPSETGQEGIRWKTVEGVRQRETIYPYEKSETLQRVYKGEGTISLICYFPFAKSAFKTVPTGHESDSWVISSGIKTSEEMNGIDEYIYNNETSKGSIIVYNPGDVETGFKLYIPSNHLSSEITISCGEDSLVLNPITSITDNGILINTTTGLITGAANINSPTRALYNYIIKSGYLFHLQPNSNTQTLEFTGINSNGNNIVIDYDYLYF